MRLLTLLFALVTLSMISTTPCSSFSLSKDPLTMAIDSTDTVYFDLSKAQIIGNQLTFPGGIITNQPVNSLDFSFKYNHSDLDYDTVTTLASNLQALAYYNVNDSTVRYTSNSLSPIAVGVNLIQVQFNLNGFQIDSTDFAEVKGYLNGVKCTAVFLNQLTVGLNDISNLQNILSVFPNPARDMLKISAQPNSPLSLFSVKGELVNNNLQTDYDGKLMLDVRNLPDGTYIIKMLSSNKSASVRFLVAH